MRRSDRRRFRRAGAWPGCSRKWPERRVQRRAGKTREGTATASCETSYFQYIASCPCCFLLAGRGHGLVLPGSKLVEMTKRIVGRVLVDVAQRGIVEHRVDEVVDVALELHARHRRMDQL